MRKEPNKPRILFIATNIPTPKRQSNKVVMTIAHKLSAQFDVSVMHPAEWAPFPINLMKKYKNIAGSESWEDDGIVVRPFKYIRLVGSDNAFRLLPYYGKKTLSYCQRHGTPHLVHAHYALPDGYLAYLLFKAYKVPYIISFRKSDIKLLQTKENCSTHKMMQMVLSHAHKIIVHNRAQQILLQEYGFDSILMPHGIEADFLKPKSDGGAKDEIVIASIGELIPQKHIDWVINAVKNYKGEKKLTLLIAGEGPQKEELDRLTNGSPNIKLLGKIKHDAVNELLCDSDIFALPSYNETFGLVYIEATAHQNAVIASKGTGIWGHFKENEEMLYCDSFESFKQMLFYLIDNDEARNLMAQKAFDKTSEHFTWDKVIEKYCALYKATSILPNNSSAT